MLRVDIEAERGRGQVPRENYDISHLVKGKMDREDRAEAIAEVFCGVIARQKKIVTDRLHVSIACGLLGIPCEMKANSYHKNRSIYEESIKKFFPWVAFSV
jgi:exopolysaccharide biosynthesis predicted pyruvyltransferase EpsI